MDVRVGSIKNAEHRRIDAFELWCWRRLLRVAWTARRSNQSLLKEINPEYSLEALTDAKAETLVLCLLNVKNWLIGKTLMLGKIEGRRRRRQQRMRWLDGITDSMFTQWVWVNPGSWCWTGRPGMLQSMGSQSWTRLRDSSELNWTD